MSVDQEPAAIREGNPERPPPIPNPTFYDKNWRETMRREPLVAKEHLNLERFQSVAKVLQDANTYEAAKNQLITISSVLFALCQAMRDRGIADDMVLLEALTVFDVDPDRKRKNSARSTEYMRHLLSLRPKFDELQHGTILNACASWFALRDDEQYNAKLNVTEYFGRFAERPDLQPFVSHALFWLRRLFTTVVVETEFSARNLVQSDQRTSLSGASLRAALVFKDEAQYMANDDAAERNQEKQFGRKQDYARCVKLLEEIKHYQTEQRKQASTLRGVQRERTIMEKTPKRKQTTLTTFVCADCSVPEPKRQLSTRAEAAPKAMARQLRSLPDFFHKSAGM